MKKRRLLSILMCLCMVVALMPQMVFANDDTDELQGKLNAGGTVTLEKDYTIDTTLNVTKDVTLDLNGHVIKMTVGAGVIRINKSVKLTLQDSNPTAEHDDTTLPAGGVITGGSAESSGGVYVVGGEFIMDGGTIYNCRSSASGGGVCVDGGSFTMTGGAIYDCVAQYGGGVDVSSHGSFTMTGGSIFDCNADENGSAVSVNTDSIVNANGGTIKGVVYSHGCIQNTDTDGCTVFYGVIDNYGSMSGNTVTFKNEDSSYATEIVAEGNKAAKPIEPDAPEGMVFAGWYLDEELKTPYDFESEVKDNITLYAGWEEEKITLTVPFTTTVEVSGNASPGETTFNLEVVDSQGNELSCDNVKITAESVTTNGAGSYDGKIAFTGKDYEILRMFADKEFVFVKQTEGDYPNWKVDDTVWCLSHSSAAELSEDEAEPSPIVISKATIEESENGIFYNINEDEGTFDNVSFTNKYNKQGENPAASEDTTGGDSDDNADKNAKTGDNVNLTLWITLMLLSVAGITGTAVYTRRKRTNE